MPRCTTHLALFLALLACNPSTSPPIAAPPPPAPEPATAPGPEREPEAGCRSERSGNLGHPSGEWFSGTDTRACAALIEPASHDGSYGKTRIVFDGGPSAPQVTHELTGIYRIFSHSPRAHAFVIGGQFETGVFVLVERLGLIDDRDGSLRWSKYQPPLRIVSIVASPDGDTLALIAAPENADMRPFLLWSYRPADDALSRLGPAPGPPPDDWECDRAYPSRWLTMPGNEAYADMDPGVITFSSPDELQVSYGADTCESRAKKRTVRRWNLANAKPWQQPARSADELEN
jgi:hypothetical protein